MIKGDMMPTYAGFLESWKRVDEETLRLGLGQLDGTTVVVEGRTTPQCADWLESLFADRPDTWFEIEIHDDGRLGRYHNKPFRAPRGELVRGSFASMQEFKDCYLAIGLRDEESCGGSIVVRKCTNAGRAVELLTSSTDAIVEIKIDQNLSVISAALVSD
ncbi:MAG: hypothetical protein NXI14_05935 [bacterium]|nr:hypothetical protein [bacterium]